MRDGGGSADTLAIARSLVAEATERELDEVPEDAGVRTWDPWNSLAHMRLILLMEQNLGKDLPPQAVVGITTIDDVATALSDAR